MKSTGIVRRVDELGRVVIPVEVRRTLDINHKDSIEMFVDHNNIVLKKYVASSSCILCDEAGDTVGFKGKQICRSCSKELSLTPVTV